MKKHWNEELLNAFMDQIMEPDLIRGNYYPIDSRYKKYVRSIKLLDELQEAGILTYRADNPNIPYVAHSIAITWKILEEVTSVEAAKFAQILFGVEHLMFDPYAGDGFWVLSGTLYRPVCYQTEMEQ